MARLRGEGRRIEGAGRAATTGDSEATTGASDAITGISSTGAPVDDSSAISSASTGGAAVDGRPNRDVVMDTTGPADELREAPANKIEGLLAPIPMLGRNDTLIELGEALLLWAWKPPEKRLEEEKPRTGVGVMEAEEAAAADEEPRRRKNWLLDDPSAALLLVLANMLLLAGAEMDERNRLLNEPRVVD